MITSILFDGELGSGKTLSAVSIGLNMSARAGIPLLSNMTIKGSYKIERPSDWALIAGYREKGSILLLDEAQSILDSRTTQSKGQIRFTEFLMYLRKMRCLVIFTTPSFDMVDLRVRQRLSYRLFVSKVKGRVVWDIYEPYTGVFKHSKLINQEALKGYYPFYDTYELVAPIELPTDLRDFLQVTGSAETSDRIQDIKSPGGLTDDIIQGWSKLG